MADMSITVGDLELKLKTIIYEMKRNLNQEKCTHMNNFINLSDRYTNMLGKKYYLSYMKERELIPKHLLDGLFMLDNRFNNNFLMSGKHGSFFNNMGIKLINLDIKQAMWRIKGSKKALDKEIDNLTRDACILNIKVKKIIDEYIKLKTKLVYMRLDKKSNRVHKVWLNKPYHKGNDGFLNKKTSIKGRNINRICKLNNAEDRTCSMVEEYYKLHLNKAVINLSNTVIPTNILNLLNLGENTNIFPDNLKLNICNMIAEVENILYIQEITDNHKNMIRNKMSGQIFKFLEHNTIRHDPTVKAINRDLKGFIDFKKKNRI